MINITVKEQQDNGSAINDINTTLGIMQDGNDGSTWDALIIKPNLKDHETRISDNESDISDANIIISSHTTSISNLNSSTSTLNQNLATEITNRTNGDTNIMQQLASTALNKGASYIGINDVAGKYTSTTVEGALAEVDDKIALLAGALAWQSPVNDYASSNC